MKKNTNFSARFEFFSSPIISHKWRNTLIQSKFLPIVQVHELNSLWNSHITEQNEGLAD